ncbi:zinc ribbon domain-containing protein [Halanaerobacter jeridensis]|uniref:zinc ribbon domain-containing protein n=1 Tax=Halanaerobacter jeridensis TaxID=706427 RepID=UPI001956B276|nr:zinc ribbon domain-containing protein [Halanaerobacter jeridensis]
MKQIASGEEKLQNYILKQIKIAPLTVDELLQKCKKDRRHPLIVEENIFYKVVERLIAAEEVYKVGEKNKLSLDLINNQQQELDEYTINEEDDLSLDTDSEATNDFLDKEEDIEEIADEEEEEVLDDLDIGIGEHFLNIESEDQKTLEECPNCGFELAGDEKMCPRCGIELY